MGTLDGLIKYLVDAVAIRGAESADILNYTIEYYKHHQFDAGYTGNEASVSREKQKIDEKFQRKVWTWLTRQPGISVGKNAQGIAANLAGPILNYDDLPHEDIDGRQQGASTRSGPDVRLTIHASENQIWQAIAGHALDYDKVPRLDFVLLTVIASHGDRGILQPDLVRATGQDKRSVPSRTQRLSDRGYIRKSHVVADSKRTSLLVLSRFADLRQPSEAQEPTHPIRRPQEKMVDHFGHSKFLPQEQLIRKIIDALKEDNILIWDDLKKKLGVFRDGKASRRLAEAVRRFEELGVLQRVRARLQNETPKDLHRCVKLCREPTEADWRDFFDEQYGIHHSSLKEREESLRSDSKTLNQTGDSNDHQNTDTNLNQSINLNEQSTSTIPLSWNPDRLLVHIIHDSLADSGERGLSLQSIRQRTTGIFFRRPLEQVMGRLVSYWQVSQPKTLRHLAVIRDAAQSGRIGYYIHYTHCSFEAKVQKGEVAWDAVQTLEEPESQEERDDYGFTFLHISQFQGQSNNASLAECVEGLEYGANSKRKPSSTPRKEVGNQQGPQQQGAMMRGRNRNTLTQSGQLDQSVVRRPRGRPRKQPKMDTQLNMVALVKDQRDPMEPQSSGIAAANLYLTPHDLARPAQPPILRYLPSIAAHDARNAYWLSCRNGESSQSIREPLEHTTGPRSQRPTRKGGSLKEKLHDSSPLTPDSTKGKPPSSTSASLSLTYEQQLALTTRVGTGLFLGPATSLRASGTRGRPRKCRIAVFKLRNLKNLSWFTDHSSASMGQHLPGSSSRRQICVSVEPDNTSSPFHEPRPQADDVLDSCVKDGESEMLLGSGSPTSVHDRGLSPIRRSQKRKRGSEQDSTSGFPCKKLDLTLHEKRSDASNWNLDMVNGDQSEPTDFPVSKQDASITSKLNAVETQPAAQEMYTSRSYVVTPQLVTSGNLTAHVTQANYSTHEVPESLDRLEAQRAAGDYDESGLEMHERGKNEMAQSNKVETGTTPNLRRLTESSAKMHPFGGSTARARRETVMEIVQMCDGVHPGGTELMHSVAAAMSSRGATTLPDKKTTQQVKKFLIGEGKLQEITFTFRDKQGLIHARTIVALSSLDPHDSNITALQNLMAHSYPLPYFPSNAPVHRTSPSSLTRITQSEGVKNNKLYANLLPIEPESVKSLFPKKKAIPTLRTPPSAAKGRSEMVQIPRPLPRTRNILQKEVSLPKAQQAKPKKRPKAPEVAIVAKLPQPSKAPKHSRAPEVIEVTKVPKRSKAPELTKVAEVPKCSSTSTRVKSAKRAHPLPFLDSAGQEGSINSDKRLNEVTQSSTHVYAVPKGDQIISATASKKVFESMVDNVADWEQRSFDHSRGFAADTWIHYQYPGELDGSLIPDPTCNVSGYHDQSSTAITRTITLDTSTKESPRKPPGEPRLPATKPKQAPGKPRPPAAKPKLPAGKRKSLGSGADLTSTRPAKKRKVPNVSKQPNQRGPVEVDEAARQPSMAESERPQGKGNVTARRTRSNATFDDNDDRRLIVAVVMTRVLLGGVELNLNWDIVAKMVSDKHDIKALKRRWVALRVKYKQSLDHSYSKLREAFLEGYRQGSIPAIDFDNLTAHDWQWFPPWGLEVLDGPSRVGRELPSTRKAYDSSYKMGGSQSIIPQYFGLAKQNTSIPKRHALAHQTPRCILETPARSAQRKIQVLDLAKNWVRANIMTPGATYNPEYARSKLSYFRPDILDLAVLELSSERKIISENKGRVLPTRAYNLSGKYMGLLKLKLQPNHFAEAVAFKKNLDDKLRISNRMVFNQAPSVGQMVALINLAAYGMIQFDQEGLPSDKFGLLEDDYRTRAMEKEKLDFKVIIDRGGAYQYGLPLAPLPSKPSDHSICKVQGDTVERFPLWVDINGDHNTKMWQIALSAVLCLLSLGSGSRATELERELDANLEEYEISLVFKWLVDAGAAGWDSDGQERLHLLPWWWTVC